MWLGLLNLPSSSWLSVGILYIVYTRYSHLNKLDRLVPACYRYLHYLSVIAYHQSLHPEVNVINISEQDVDNINNFYCRLDQNAQRFIELFQERGSGSCSPALPLGRLLYHTPLTRLSSVIAFAWGIAGKSLIPHDSVAVIKSTTSTISRIVRTEAMLYTWRHDNVRDAIAEYLKLLGVKMSRSSHRWSQQKQKSSRRETMQTRRGWM